MSISGKNASFNFAGTVYDSDDCLQGFNLNKAIAKALYFCNGNEKAAPGAATRTFQVSLALNATDTAKIAALKEETTGTLEFHPAGDSAGNIEFTCTNATVEISNLAGSPTTVLLLDVTFHLDDLTDGAAV